jgi:hypothetical protein
VRWRPIPHIFNERISWFAAFHGVVKGNLKFIGIILWLTGWQQLSRYGVRLNTRETERKRKRKGYERSVTPTPTRMSRGGGGRKNKGECECD